MTSSHPTLVPCQWFVRLASALDKRSAPRLALLTVATWTRTAGLSGRFRSCCFAVAAAGKRADAIARRLLSEVGAPLAAGSGRLTPAIDDTPTRRYGPFVQGAVIHHNPTPGLAGSPHLYGHVFVVLALLVAPPAWGAIALPLLSRLYVRAKDLPAIDPKHRPASRTKLTMAAGLLRWARPWLDLLGRSIWVVADRAYAKKELLEAGITVVSRLRKDAALRTVPGPRLAGTRGRPRIYDERAVDLVKRAGRRRGWSTGLFDLYGGKEAKRYKTFLATWRPAGGVIRVVLVDEPHGWRAYFCTDPAASVANVLETIADRFSLEIAFREVKEVVGAVVGAGEQQTRFLHASVGAFHACLWTYTLTEAWAWRRSEAELVDRSDSPWDSPTRRPSHADKRRAWRREILAEEILAIMQADPSEAEIQAAADRLLGLAA
jgi:hypothetical protein